jgi:hypothetical protein
VAARNAAAPEITDVQRAFVSASEEAEATRLSKERAQLEVIRTAQEATRKQQRRAARLLWGVAALVLATAGYVTWQSYEVARREINVFTARAREALNGGEFDRAMRYALQVYPARGRLPWTTPFSTELESKLAGGAQFSWLYRTLKGHSALVTNVEFKGKQVATASRLDHTTRLWDAESGKQIGLQQGAAFDSSLRCSGARQLAFTADGKRVVTAFEDNTARISDVVSGKAIAVLKGHTDTVYTAAFSADGKRVVTASTDKTAGIWDAESGTKIAEQNITTWIDVEGWGLLTCTPSAGNGDGNRMVTTSNDNSARILSLEGSEILNTVVLKGHTAWVVAVAFSADGKRVVTISQDDTARIWDAESGR